MMNVRKLVQETCGDGSFLCVEKEIWVNVNYIVQVESDSDSQKCWITYMRGENRVTVYSAWLLKEAVFKASGQYTDL